MVTTDKQQLYFSLSERISPLWKQDEMMAAQDPDSWQLARTIDDWLIHYGGWTISLEKEEFAALYQDHDRVSVEQYQRNCQRMQELYDTWTPHGQGQAA